jgi:transcriptional regulator with XRE-family HTH domain
MSTEPETSQNPGFPELTELGKRIEVLRIQRGLSKQQLAKHAGTSRQQLWRVMTGKSELTPSLRQRLAEVLRVDPSATARGEPADAQTAGGSLSVPLVHALAVAALSATLPNPVSLEAFIAHPPRLELVLRLLPAGDDGRRLKRRLLDMLEDAAIEHDCKLTAEFFELRRRVLAGEL